MHVYFFNDSSATSFFRSELGKPSIANTGAYLSPKQIDRLLLLAFGISQSKSINMSYVNDAILVSESGCKNESSQYKHLLKVFQTGDYENVVRNSFQLVVIYFYGGQEYFGFC